MSQERNRSDARAPRRAVGLQYEPGQGLPQVIAKGSGDLAEEMIRRAQRGEQVPVVQDAALAEQLYRLPTDAQIGPELFHLVAALLAHVFAIEQRLKGNKT